MPGTTEDIHFALNADFTANVLDSADGEPTGVVGHWTVVYDQGLVVELPNEAKFIANFRYNLKDENMDPTQYKTLGTGDYDKFTPKCSETMVGIKQLKNEAKELQCFVGK